MSTGQVSMLIKTDDFTRFGDKIEALVYQINYYACILKGFGRIVKKKSVTVVFLEREGVLFLKKRLH